MENKTDAFFKQTKNWICYKSANKVCWKIFLRINKALSEKNEVRYYALQGRPPYLTDMICWNNQVL